MNLDEMPPALRKAAVAALARDLARRQAPPPARTTSSRTRSRSTCRYRCARCGALLASWAAAERHGDQTTHARYECALDAVPPGT